MLLIGLLGGCVSLPGAELRAPTATPHASGDASHPAPQLAADRLIAADGTALPMRQWLPAGQPHAVVLALHGFNDYSNAFAAPGAAWGPPRHRDLCL
ncbi:MAG: hypothetical protein WDO24_23260 [Pseudomonadota bacterium]